jgi:hypothetical protein
MAWMPKFSGTYQTTLPPFGVLVQKIDVTIAYPSVPDWIAAVAVLLPV